MELAAIGHAVELGALPGNSHLLGVDVGTDANDVGADQSESDCGSSGTTAEIKHTAHLGS